MKNKTENEVALLIWRFPRRLKAKMKARAAMRGITLMQAVTAACERWIEREESAK